jgi:hypothetical protein
MVEEILEIDSMHETTLKAQEDTKGQKAVFLKSAIFVVLLLAILAAILIMSERSEVSSPDVIVGPASDTPPFYREEIRRKYIREIWHIRDNTKDREENGMPLARDKAIALLKNAESLSLRLQRSEAQEIQSLHEMSCRACSVLTVDPDYAERSKRLLATVRGYIEYKEFHLVGSVRLEIRKSNYRSARQLMLNYKSLMNLEHPTSKKLLGEWNTIYLPLTKLAGD